MHFYANTLIENLDLPIQYYSNTRLGDVFPILNVYIGCMLLLYSDLEDDQKSCVIMLAVSRHVSD